ncbi:MAG: hypothetical protein AAGH57_05425 [Pseudomonadota bacterium]
MSYFPIPDWAAELDTAAFTDPAQLETRAAKFERTIKRRNRIEYAAGALCVLGFGAASFFAFRETQHLIAGAFAFCTACVLVVLWQLSVRGSYRASQPEESCLSHLRGQYERQYRALRDVPQWYLGPIALGVIAVYAAMITKFAEMGGLAKALGGTWQPMLSTLTFFAFVWWLNWFAAKKLKRQIERIDALG